MNVLELFSGSQSFTNVAKERGHNTFTSDYKDFPSTDYVTNILEFDVYKVPFVPNVIWASPPCTYFSVCSIGHHWNKDNTPKTENAKLGMEIAYKTRQVISHFSALNSDLIYFVENPRGKLRKLNIFNPYHINTVTYCQYASGDEMRRMKPTDIWTNLTNIWIPRTMCRNGDNCHESAPRGSRTGTQGLKGNFERSRVPSELCLELLELSEQMQTYRRLELVDRPDSP